ncbi:MAG: Coq4 family protein, partial [Myxococcota bacterium]
MEATSIYPERNLWAAARDAAIWLSGPVSERGAARASRMALHMGGRMVHERRLAMREHPDGRRLLAERPDLCAALNDMPGLAALPEGSLGRAFHT